MNKRFLQYLRVRSISQARLAELSGVSISTISRFCRGGAIGTNNLVLLLKACENLSLDWLFFERGPMLKDAGGPAGGNLLAGGRILEDRDVPGVISELLRATSDRDRVIHDRDATITELHRLLLALQGKGVPSV